MRKEISVARKRDRDYAFLNEEYQTVRYVVVEYDGYKFFFDTFLHLFSAAKGRFPIESKAWPVKSGKVKGP